MFTSQKSRKFALKNQIMSVKRLHILLFALLFSLTGSAFPKDSVSQITTEDIIDDICRMLRETDDNLNEDPDALSELQEQLLELSRQPLNLYSVREEELRQLHFLSEQQIEQLLLFVHDNRPVTPEELKLVPGFKSWEMRNLLPFITLNPTTSTDDRLYARRVFKYAKHEITARVDARNIEDTTQHDPFYIQLKYKFNYQNRVRFGFTLRRPTGSPATGLQYGGYIQLSKIGPLETLVVGDYKASFGLGLVLSEPFHSGKRAYVTNAGMQADQLTYYSSPNTAALHGAGLTLRFPMQKNAIPSYVELSALYSFNRENDTLIRHTAGLNLTFRHKKLKLGLTAVEKFYSDSVRYYFNKAAYNQNYFRGTNQAVLGLNIRYNFGRWDLFGEVATAQNKKWGIASIVGLRATPWDDISFVLLHRYYSLYWDNPLGYGFSETSRLNDENGIYLGLEVKSIRKWVLNGYVDLFRFAGPKYRINYYPSLGYDALLEAHYQTTSHLFMNMRARAREKAKQTRLDLRYQLRYTNHGWQLQTTAEANTVRDSLNHWTFGAALSQDIAYTFHIPLVLQARLQGFYIPYYDNRIYIYENDVLYAFSSTFVNGIGGRCYLNLRWQCHENISLYFRLSETLLSDRIRSAVKTRTDLHLLLRATF